MNPLVTILLILVAAIGVLLIIALFVKKEYTIAREITINKPKQEVFNYLKFIRNQDFYNKWIMIDPSLKKDFRGTDGTVGFVYAWDGNQKAGRGEQEIKNITDGERIDLELRFIKPFEGIAKAPMTTESVSIPGQRDQTKVTWGMEGKSKYPMNLMNLLLNGMLGKDLDASLAMLKSNLEKR